MISSRSLQCPKKISYTLTREQQKTRSIKMKKISDARRYVLKRNEIREQQSIYYRKKKEQEDQEYFEIYGETPPDKRTSKLELKWRYRLKKMYPDIEVKYNHEPTWLINPVTKRKLEIDIYFPLYKVGIEVQGRQHLKFTPHWHKTYEKYEDQVFRDCIKQILYVYKMVLSL